jgi:hypothetical protein
MADGVRRGWLAGLCAFRMLAVVGAARAGAQCAADETARQPVWLAGKTVMLALH